MCQKSLHIFLRIASITTPIEEIVRAHDEIATREGNVWFGIKTRPLSTDTVTSIRQQIGDGRSAYFYLAQRRDDKFKLFRGNVNTLSRDLPREETNLIPPYYDVLGISSQMKFWLNLSVFESVSETELSRLYIDSTGTCVAKALNRSMLSLATIYRE